MFNSSRLSMYCYLLLIVQWNLQTFTLHSCMIQDICRLYRIVGWFITISDLADSMNIFLGGITEIYCRRFWYTIPTKQTGSIPLRLFIEFGYLVGYLHTAYESESNQFYIGNCYTKYKLYVYRANYRKINIASVARATLRSVSKRDGLAIIKTTY